MSWRWWGSAAGEDAKSVERSYQDVTHVGHNLIHIRPTTIGNGRVLEPLAAQDFPTYLVTLDGTRVSTQVATALDYVRNKFGEFTDVVLVDTGGDSLYPNSNSGDHAVARATPDQDLLVLDGFARLAKKIGDPVRFTSAVVAVGVDSPDDVESVLGRAEARYWNPSDQEVESILARYEHWNLTGRSDQLYGKTPYAWQSALRGEVGTQVVPLPSAAVLSRSNPWNPYVRVPVRGVFVMELEKHLAAITAVR